MRKLIYAALLATVLMGCAAPAESPAPETTTEETLMRQFPEIIPETVPETTAPKDPLRLLLDSMTLEQRVGQLFLARHPQSGAVEDLQKYHLGGYILFAVDFEGKTPEQIRSALASYQEASEIPMLIAVDEEGGTVTRVSRYSAFRSEKFASPRTYYNRGGMEAVLAAEEEKAQLLTSLGINVNMGPVADVARDPSDFMYYRSLGQDARTTGAFVADTAGIYRRYHLGSVLKHFPGYGGNADTHTGSVLDNRSLSALESQDLIPFRSGIEGGCDAILVSHNIIAALDESLPASLSPAVYRYLRHEMGFEGVAVTDDLVMEAVMALYDPGEAAVRAVNAGSDLLCCSDYATQYDAVLAAVLEGRISIDRLNEAVLRVLRWKQDLGLLNN